MKLIFTGDLLLGGDFLDQKISSSNFDIQLLNKLRNTNHIIINFENTIGKSQNLRKDKDALFYCTKNTFKSFINLFPNVILCLGNNHINDFGDEALLKTKKILEFMKIKNYGAGYIDDIKKPLIIDEQIALLNFSEASSHINSIIANKKQMGCMEFNLNEFLEILKNDNLKERIFIITLHWGYERIILPSEKQIELAHQLIDLGVDLVIGHHPHIIQSYEVYKGKYIFYSLGNFFFPNYYGYKSGIYYEWNKLNCYSIIITVEIQDNKKLNISFEGLEFNNKQFKLGCNPIGKTLLIKYSNLLTRLNKKENYDSIFRKYLQKFYFSDNKSTLLSIIINFYSVFNLFKKNNYSFIHRIKKIISFKRICYLLKLLSDNNNWFNYNQYAMIKLIDKILNFSN